MRMTGNRKLILRLLDEELNGDLPPHSASHIDYNFTDCFSIEATKKYYGINTFPSKKQIERTLKDLWHSGHIIATRRLMEPCNVNNMGLPYWVRYYQTVANADHNYIISETKDLHYKTRQAKYGSTIFGSVPFGYGLLPDDVITLKRDIKALAQKCHPDKQSGYEAEFKQLAECLTIIRSGIPLPTDEVNTLDSEPAKVESDFRIETITT